jgi:hypothetical protein
MLPPVPANPRATAIGTIPDHDARPRGGTPAMATASTELRSPMLAQLIGELDRIEPRARVVVSGLSESKFTEVPPDGGWSVAQVFEHLCVANHSYLDGPLPAAIAKAKARGRTDKPWKPSFTGGWLTRMLVEGTKPVTTPRLYRVGSPRSNVVDEFLRTVARGRELMLDVDGYDLGVGLASPVTPLIRPNVGDALRILVVHAHRHLGQAERTRRAVGT